MTTTIYLMQRIFIPTEEKEHVSIILKSIVSKDHLVRCKINLIGLACVFFFKEMQVNRKNWNMLCVRRINGAL